MLKLRAWHILRGSDLNNRGSFCGILVINSNFRKFYIFILLNLKPQPPQDIEKAAYAQIHNAGFPDIVDCDGRPAIELDLSKHYIYSPALENNDPRTCNTVVFQFLAVSFNKTPIRYYNFKTVTLI